MKFLCVFFLSLVTLPGVCEGLQISEAWSRATVEGRMGAVYATIENTSDRPIRIEGIKTSVAMMAQVHESYLDNGMMRMRHIEQFTIPAGEVRKLAPGGLHIMLMRLPKPLVEGTTFETKFELDSGDDLGVPVVVGSMGQMSRPE